MMRGVVATLERHHNVRILDEAVEACVRLSHRYMPGRQLPDKSVSVLDTACARLALGQNSAPPTLESVQRQIDSFHVQKRILERESAVGADHSERIAAIEKDIETSNEELKVLNAQWEKEKSIVAEIRALQAQLEQGTGEKKPTPDGSPIEGTPLNEPRSMDLDPKGNLYLVLRQGNAVYRIDSKEKKIHHLAGTGEKGNTGDGADARQAKLNGPKGIAYSSDGGVYIADTENHTIRRIDLKSGVITTVLGTGERGDGPDGDPLKCKLARPHGIFVDKNGIVYVSNSEAHRVLVLK